MIKTNLQENPVSIEKEISILKELGLELYEIEFLIYQKHKQELREKWKEQQEKLQFNSKKI